MSTKSSSLDGVVLRELQRIRRAEAGLVEMYRSLESAGDRPEKTAAFIYYLNVLENRANWLDRLLDSAGEKVAAA